jgi:hypothetical protein
MNLGRPFKGMKYMYSAENDCWKTVRVDVHFVRWWDTRDYLEFFINQRLRL